MLKTLINSACSKHTQVMEIFHACGLFAKWTAARTTCLMIWRRPSGGLGSKEKSTWPSLPGNSVNAFWDCCSQRWTGLKIRGGIEMTRTFLHRTYNSLCLVVVVLRTMSATLCQFFYRPKMQALEPMASNSQSKTLPSTGEKAQESRGDTFITQQDVNPPALPAALPPVRSTEASAATSVKWIFVNSDRNICF